MKLMLRPEWRLWPLASFLGLLDLKTGVTVALLFALLNKVAGIYGLIAVVTGAGGSFAQLTLYIYSVVALVALVWGLRVVKEEDPKKTLYFAHLFVLDHVFSSSWTIFFALAWWIWTPHDGQRQSNSPAQQQIKLQANVTNHITTPADREAAALEIWNHEKGMAAAVIITSWLFKIYFALLIYSYASHLRKGSYRALPRSRAAYSAVPNAHTFETALGDQEDEEIEDFYRVPLRAPQGHRRAQSSRTGFADFVSAPGRTPLSRTAEEDALFDEDEATYAASSSSRTHSKLGTDGGSTAASDEERYEGKGKVVR